MCIGRARSSRRAAALFACAAVLMAACGLAPAAWGAERYDPRLRFRTIRTAHFDIHAHQGEEALARRIAAIAERVRAASQATLGVPRGRVQVILVDQTDLANGWATPVPYDTIEITAAPPAIASVIGHTTDWLELVFVHEYTHILHLDRSRGFMQGVRRIFGRVPPAFPNAFLPLWQIEGLATFQESRTTGQGRLAAGDFRAIVDVAAANGRFEPIDRANGGITDWPGGHAPYAYGAYFHEFLADRYGAERLTQLADATSGRLPFFGAGAFKKVFGRSAPDLWNEFRASRGTRPAGSTDGRARRLTTHGFTVTAPRVSADGTIFYAVSNPHGFPALMRLSPAEEPVRVAWRALGSGTAVGAEWVVFDQVERARSVAIHSDLYAVRQDGGEVRRLTYGARAADPDLSPDERRIVCTVQATGRRALAIVDFRPGEAAVPRVIAGDRAADYEAPRWSPDGRRIAAARRHERAFELVLIDPESGDVQVLLRRTDGRMVTPAWTADGQSVLFAAAADGAPFNIYEIDVTTRAVEQITDAAGGAHFPALATDGTLVYVGYTVDGSDLFAIALNPADRAGSATRSEVHAGDPNPQQARPVMEDAGQISSLKPEAASSSGYNPLRTLLPTFWTPLIETDAGETVIGVGTAMTDALGRHGYAVDAGWNGRRARPDWQVSYAYDRWRPTLFASYSDDTDPVQDAVVRSRELFAGALWRFRRLRASDTLLAGFDAQTDTLICDGGCPVSDFRRDRRSLRAGWLHDTRRQFGYSISAEEGFALQTAVETSRDVFGSEGNAAAAIVDLRGFRRVLARHTVLAARIGAAASFGDDRARRVFSAAGAGPSHPVFDFGRDTIGLLRGFSPDAVVGTRAVAANVDLRVPIARLQRGLGTWPLFLHSIHAAGFVDAGHAWDAGPRASDIRTAIGVELAADLVVLHYVPLTVVAGTAWTRDPGADRRRVAFFARVGYAY